MGPLLLTLLTAAGAGCPEPPPGAARHATAIVVVGEPKLARELAGPLAAKLRCTPGFAELSEPIAARLEEARRAAGPRCAARASCLLERLPLAGVERLVLASVVVRDGLVFVELSLRAPPEALPIARSARAASPGEAGSTAATLLGRLLAQRDPVSEAFARRAEDPGAFEALAADDPAWRHVWAGSRKTAPAPLEPGAVPVSPPRVPVAVPRLMPPTVPAPMRPASPPSRRAPVRPDADRLDEDDEDDE